MVEDDDGVMDENVDKLCRRNVGQEESERQVYARGTHPRTTHDVRIGKRRDRTRFELAMHEGARENGPMVRLRERWRSRKLRRREDRTGDLGVGLAVVVREAGYLQQERKVAGAD